MTELSTASANRSTASRNTARGDVADAFEKVAGALNGLQYGEVRVIVQDGLIVQIERTEKQRLR